MKVHLTRSYGFSASHRLHSPQLSDEENRALYGKCNNPHGHGHNYEVEVTVAGPVNPVTGRAVDLVVLDRIIDEEILTPLRHRNINEEFEAFRGPVVPTTENLAAEVYRRLSGVWALVFASPGVMLEKVRILETERNICEVWD
jgi:6-pyruvoyltetrahydropterin/6-carboxytetrahydropterin synthase